MMKLTRRLLRAGIALDETHELTGRRTETQQRAREVSRGAAEVGANRHERAFDVDGR
jgi:hypothetical protein